MSKPFKNFEHKTPKELGNGLNLDGMVHFLRLMGRLKRTPRSGWIKKVGIERPESVADHSFRVALLCMLLADLKGLDTLKLVRMALLHDVGEALIGDLTREDVQKKEREDEAMMKILSLLPSRIASMYAELWGELWRAESAEAKFVREVDKLEMVLQALEYEKEGYERRNLAEFWKSVAPFISDSDLQAILKRLEEERGRLS